MPRTLFLGQVTAMLSIIPMTVSGSMSEWIVTLVMYLGIVTLGISVGYHRYLSHRMFECNTVLAGCHDVLRAHHDGGKRHIMGCQPP